MTDTVKDPLIELLAIALYREDAIGLTVCSWLKCDPEDREIYRRIARGEDPLNSDDADDDQGDDHG